MGNTLKPEGESLRGKPNNRCRLLGRENSILDLGIRMFGYGDSKIDQSAESDWSGWLQDGRWDGSKGQDGPNVAMFPIEACQTHAGAHSGQMRDDYAESFMSHCRYK